MSSPSPGPGVAPRPGGTQGDSRRGVLFPTLDYLIFLPLSLLVFHAVPRAAKLPVLALASAAFYASWSPSWLLLLLAMGLLAWLFGLWLERREGAGPAPGHRRLLAALALSAPLFLVKYADWLAWNLEQVLPGLHLPRADLPLPVGISFFTFQALAYVIDVGRPLARGGGEPERDPLRFAVFLGFFPQLVAGPILRRRELLPELRRLPLLQGEDVGQGLFRIGLGLGKKVLVADPLSVGMVDPVMADPGRFTGLEVLVALYAYTIQIYYDFSAYTDIALGSARLFGFRLPENFRRPYQATCVAGFWRRWHITLSNWVRDYVYYPLGGSRVEGGAEWKVYRNLMLTLLIIGIWHGASWNFVAYGLLHGLAVSWCRYRRKRTGRAPDDPLPSAGAWAWRWLLTFHFVVLGRVLFRTEDLRQAGMVLARLGELDLLMPRFSPTSWIVLLLGFAAHMSPESWRESLARGFRRAHPALWALAAAALGVACLEAGSGDRLAFIYYQF